MKKIYFCILIIAMISCNHQKDDYLISGDSAGSLNMGMDVDKVKALFTNCTFEEVDLANFGVDGGGTGFLVKKQNEWIVVFWANEQKKVAGIICLSSKYHTKKGIRPKMNVKELKKIFPNATIQINLIFSNYEFIILKKEKVSVDFISSESNRVGKYKNIDPEEATSEMRLDARIYSIGLMGD
jgi:hypothetical protein